MNFIVSTKNGPHGLLLIVTDEEIIGKLFAENKLQLDLTKKFYQGTKKGKTAVMRLVSTAQHLHLTGKAAVALGIEMDLVNPDSILYVQGIPHAEVTV